MIAGQTNLYAEQYRETNPNLPRNSRPGRWYNVTNREMKDFIALLLLTGIIQKPEINHYWSTGPLLKSSIFNETMARNVTKQSWNFFTSTITLAIILMTQQEINFAKFAG